MYLWSDRNKRVPYRKIFACNRLHIYSHGKLIQRQRKKRRAQQSMESIERICLNQGWAWSMNTDRSCRTDPGHIRQPRNVIQVVVRQNDVELFVWFYEL